MAPPYEGELNYSKVNTAELPWNFTLAHGFKTPNS